MKRITFLFFFYFFFFGEGFSQYWTDHLVVQNSFQRAFQSDFVDIDQDGDLDVIFASDGLFTSDGLVGYYEQVAPGYFAPIQTISESYSNYHLGDFNNDGFSDIAILFIGGNTNIYLNRGNGQFEPQLELVDTRIADVQDINGDGFDDLILLESNGNARFSFFSRKNNTLGAFGVERYLFDGPSNVNAEFTTWNNFMDVDNDGDLDVFSLSPTNGDVLLRKNNGNGVFGTESTVYTFAANNTFNTHLRSGDLNNDGFEDLVIHSQHMPRSFWLANNNGVLSSTVNTIQQDKVYRTSYLVDLDQDGYLDLVGTDFTGTPDQFLFFYWHRNKEGTGFDSPVSFLSDTEPDLDFADFDGDGDTDVLFTGFNFSLHLNDGQNNFVPSYELFNTARDNFNVWFHEHDDKVDLFLPGPHGYRIFYHPENEFGIYDKVDRFFPKRNPYYANGFLHDLTGDGIKDFVHRGEGTSSAYYFEKAISPLEFKDSSIYILSAPGIEELNFHDLDLDGALDIVLRVNDRLFLNFNDGDGAFPTGQSTDYLKDIGKPSLYDFNGDDLIDIVFPYTKQFPSTRVIGIMRNLGNQQYSEVETLMEPPFYVEDLSLQDINEDGNIDIISSATDFSDRSLIAFVNDGFNNFQVDTLLQINTVIQEFGEPYDIDGNGYKDIVYRQRVNPGNNAEFSEIVWLENKGNLIFGDTTLAICQTTELDKSYKPADYDRDGDLDLIYFGDGDKLAWAINPFIHDFQIRGMVFYDLFENGILDPGEPGLDQSYIISTPNEKIHYSLGSGNYLANFDDPGTYMVSNSFISDDDWVLTSDSSTYTITLTDSMRSRGNIDFGFRPTNPRYGVSPDIVSMPVVCNSETKQYINIRNTGSLYAGGTLVYNLSGLTSFISASPMPDSIAQNNRQLIWHFDNIKYNQLKTYEVKVKGPPVLEINSVMNFDALVEGYDSLNNQPFSNTDTLLERVRCSYDPNDKLCEPLPVDTLSNRIPLATKSLEYTIRFQNTGNYPAKDIFIKDTLDEHLNIYALRVLSYSHPVKTSIITEDREITFAFDNIYLIDSVANEPESHGYVKFRVDVVDGAAYNSIIDNTAHIYFDANPAIVTNTQTRVLGLDTESSTEEVNPSPFTLYPNPANDFLYLNHAADFSIEEMEIFDIQGKLHGTYTDVLAPISIKALVPGLYFLRVKTSTGVFVEEFVKSN